MLPDARAADRVLNIAGYAPGYTLRHGTGNNISSRKLLKTTLLATSNYHACKNILFMGTRRDCPCSALDDELHRYYIIIYSTVE